METKLWFPEDPLAQVESTQLIIQPSSYNTNPLGLVHISAWMLYRLGTQNTCSSVNKVLHTQNTFSSIHSWGKDRIVLTYLSLHMVIFLSSDEVSVFGTCFSIFIWFLPSPLRRQSGTNKRSNITCI